LYAGAAGCDLKKGEDAGLVTFSPGNSFLINLYSEWSLAEVHFYHGGVNYPTDPLTGQKTVAPGQYTPNYSYPAVTGAPIPIQGVLGANEYFILHATVCKRA
jgi:hypothetical protein